MKENSERSHVEKRMAGEGMVDRRAERKKGISRWEGAGFEVLEFTGFIQ